MAHDAYDKLLKAQQDELLLEFDEGCLEAHAVSTITCWCCPVTLQLEVGHRRFLHQSLNN